jgi:hypothetical protein
MVTSQDSASLQAADKMVVPHPLTEEIDEGHIEHAQHDRPSVRRVKRFWWAVVLTAIVSSTFLYSLDNT